MSSSRLLLLLALSCVAAPLDAQCPDGTPPPCRAGARPPPPATNSVAVLYFENASRDTADQYLADGITEEIATSLGRIGRLHVVSPAAVRRAQQAGGADAARLARTLGVLHLVEGSVRGAGGQVRITARLLGPDARTALWTEAYTRPTADLLTMEVEIAQRVASGVVGALLPEEQRSLAATTATSVDAEAHDHILRGNFQLARRTETTIRRAIGEYEAALAIDSMYAQAWGRLALARALLRYWGVFSDAASADSDVALGERAATRALHLDSIIADPWAARAYLRQYQDPIHQTGVLAALRRAVALDPRSAEAHHQLGTGYLWRGDLERARPELLRALELEPRRLITFDNLAGVALAMARYPESVRWADSAIAVEPTHAWVYGVRALALARLGDTVAALRDVATLERLGGGPQQTSLCAVRLLTADSAATRTVCAMFLATARTSLDSAIAYAGLGDVDRSLGALETAIAHREVFILSNLQWPVWDRLRRLPRFQRVIEALRPAEDR